MARHLDPAWLAKVTKLNPMRINKDGDFVTPPVFIDFTQTLLVPQVPMYQGKPAVDAKGNPRSPSWGCTVLFQPDTDFSLMHKAMDKLYEEKKIVRQKVKGLATGPWIGQADPFLEQSKIGLDKKTGEMKTGYVEGALALRVNTYRKPIVSKKVKAGDKLIDQIIEPPGYDEVYGGAVAICVLNMYYSPTDKNTLADPTSIKGARFGLKNVLIINSNTPKWFQGGGKEASLADVQDIELSADDVINFDTGDGDDPEFTSFGDEEAFAAE